MIYTALFLLVLAADPAPAGLMWVSRDGLRTWSLAPLSAAYTPARSSYSLLNPPDCALGTL